MVSWLCVLRLVVAAVTIAFMAERSVKSSILFRVMVRLAAWLASVQVVALPREQCAAIVLGATVRGIIVTCSVQVRLQCVVRLGFSCLATWCRNVRLLGACGLVICIRFSSCVFVLFGVRIGAKL